MRKFRTRALRIIISSHALCILGVSGWFRPQSKILAETAINFDATARVESAGEQLRMALRAAASHRPVRVVLADELVRSYMVEPPRNAIRLQDCRDAATLRFQALFGVTAKAWQITADWNFDAPFLACALPGSLLEAITGAVRESENVLVEVVPHFVDAWNSMRRHISQGAWFAVLHEDTMTLAAVDQGRIIAVRRAHGYLQASDPGKWLDQTISREAMRLGMSTPQRIQVCGDVPAAWRSGMASQVPCQVLQIDCHMPKHATHMPGGLETVTGRPL